MHYNTSPLLRFFNMFLDFVLILTLFWIAGLLRVGSPFGSTFYMVDIQHYLPIAAVYALVLVCTYAVKGDYRSLHIKSLTKQAVGLACANLVGFTAMAALLFVFRIDQFSRLLLGYFYLLTVIGVLGKRVLLARAATRYVRSHDMAARVLLIGGEELAQRFYQDVVCEHKLAMKFVGYLAAQENSAIPQYLGTMKDFHEILRSRKVDRIVVASDVQRSGTLRRIVAAADTYGLRVSVIPVCNDFLSLRHDGDRVAGLHMIDAKMMDTCEIMGVNIGVTDMGRTLKMIEDKLEEWRGKYICVANVHTTVTAHEDANYRAIQNNAVIALPDGGPLSEFSRNQGYTEAQRVTGPDLMKEILKISAQKGWRHYFYGSTEETLAMMREKLQERYPGVEVVGMYSPPFREMTPQEDAQIVEQINAAQPDFVWVGLGAPKQERWMAAHEDRVQALMIGVGAAFDYEAGNIKRAPQWMQKHSLEWLYRLMQDPKRLFKRYFETNLKYLIWTWRR